MRIAIIGYGEQGRSAYEHWRSPENQITVCDKDESLSLPDDVIKQLGTNYLNNLEQFDTIVRSPAIHPRDLVAANSPAILEKVTTNTNEFFRACPSKNIIGVTGTKGKGTTSTLIAKMLEAAGKRVHLGGNIGTPPLDLLKNSIQPDDLVVLELANFQLIDLKYSPPLAVCLMVVPEHMDWHSDMAEYIAAKQQLFAHQQPEDRAIFYADNDNSKKVVSVSPGEKIPYFAEPGALVQDNEIRIASQIICKTDELKLLGKHNWQNVCAAITAAWQINSDVNIIRQTVISFTGLPFRIEFRREVNGIRYYDDSFASAPDATIAALQAIPEPKVMIIGGHDRGLDLSELAQALIEVDTNLHKVIVIGASRQRAASAFSEKGFENFVLSDAQDMASIVREASSLAQPGDAVVLSPGFPSFDMFKNFEDRGQKFNAAVEAL